MGIKVLQVPHPPLFPSPSSVSSKTRVLPLCCSRWKLTKSHLPHLLKRLTNVIDIVGSAISILPLLPTRRQCNWRPRGCLEHKNKRFPKRWHRGVFFSKRWYIIIKNVQEYFLSKIWHRGVYFPKYGTGVVFFYKLWYRGVIFSKIRYWGVFSLQKMALPLSRPLPLPQLLHQLPLQQLLLLLLNLLPLPLPPENKSVWIKSRCRCEVEATDRSLPAVQHLPARLRLLHHRLKNHRYFAGIMSKVKWHNLFGRGVAGWMRLVDVGVVHLQVPPHLHKLDTQLGLHQISWKLSYMVGLIP